MMKRWLNSQFVVPRVLTLLVGLLGVHYVLGIMARSIAIQASEAAAGVHVDVGHARVSLVDRQVVFDGLRVVNTHQPSQNVLEADRCELKFAAAAALHKQAIVESGRVSGLRFDGFTATDDSKSAENVRASREWFKTDVDLAARKWLERLNGQFSLDSVKDFDSVVRTETFCANWSKQSAGLESRLQKLDGRAAELQQSIETAAANPLRNDKLLEELRKKVAGLQKEFADFRTDVDKLPDVLDTERRAIVAARRHDNEVVGKRLQLDPVEANSLSAYLLRDEVARQLNQLVGWVRWMREAAPADAKAVASITRGENVLFAGCRPEPGMLIRSLRLDGSARIAGQPVELHGTLMNLSSAPRLHNEPIRLHLVGGGSLPLELQATIDRTRAVARDELLVDCQGVLLREMALGKADQLAMSLAPSIGSLSVSVIVDGEKLSGDIQMVQQKVQITPALNGSRGATFSAAMCDTLGHVNSIATRLSLGGTIDKPTCTLWSNMGAAVAEAMQGAVRRTGDQHAKALLVEAGRRVDERLAEVDRQMAERQTQFASKSTIITARLQKIAAGETPRYRISSETGGRRLPNNSLFR
jgi:uncharacterized protein (TIGR03545 family)